jgi:hypothetical protein
VNWTEAEYAAYLAKLTTKAAPTLAEETPEGQLLDRVRSFAKLQGWQSYHTHDSRRSEPGFPDLVLCDGRDLLIYELKTNSGKCTPEQARWLSLLEHTGKVECGIWRPRDFAAIAARLTRRTLC